MANSALRNALPNGTTLIAWTKCPTSDSKWCLSLTTLASRNSFTIPCTMTSLAGGREVEIVAVFSSMPKKVREVLGPSVLSGASGTPSSLQVASVMANALRHSSVPGDPTNKKSSR